MNPRRRRIDEATDEAFIADVEARSTDELREKRELLDDLDTELSYYRRMLHGRMDLLEFELRRRSGEETRTLLEALPLMRAETAELALDRLRPEDRFNVIQFDNHTSRLFAGPMAASPALVARAKTYVAGLTADGGTEMLSAMKAALDSSSGDGRVRQVVFLTDGSIGNESELFAAIKRRLGDRRLFTIGIGAAPNSYFMRKAAEYGRGTFTYIDDIGEVAAEMAALFVKLEQPVWITADGPVVLSDDPLEDGYA